MRRRSLDKAPAGEWATSALAEAHSVRKLIQLSAFWRNNHQRGIGITLIEQRGDLDDVLETLTNRYDVMYEEAVRESRVAQLLTDIYRQLELLGWMDKSKTIPRANLLLAIGGIWLLERYGFLEPDEFNGLTLEFED
jgi:hypothetical protein